MPPKAKKRTGEKKVSDNGGPSNKHSKTRKSRDLSAATGSSQQRKHSVVSDRVMQDLSDCDSEISSVESTSSCKCYVCKEEVTDEDHALECSCCNFWHHISCVNVSEEAYTFLDNNPELPGVKWYCTKCNRSVAKLLTSVAALSLRQDKTERQVNTLEEKVRTIDDKVENITQDMMQHVDSAVNKEACTMQQAISDSAARLNKIIAYKVPESAADDASTRMAEDISISTEILKASKCGEFAVMEAHRLGKTTTAKNDPRPLLIVLPHSYAASKVMRSQRHLKLLTTQNPLARVYLQPDYTVQQREFRQKLRAEIQEREAQGEENLKIRDWTIKKVPPRR